MTGSRGPAETVERLNAAWQAGRSEDIRPLLHPDVVMALPGWEARAEGAEAVLAGYVDFTTHARLLAYSEQDRSVDVWGRTALVTYRFDVVYERDGDRWAAAGRDMLVLARDAEWRVVWRTMLDLEERPADGDGAGDGGEGAAEGRE